MARQLDAWKLLPRPERVTELYFANHTKLPKTFVPNDLQAVSFTVHNLEHQTTMYHYKIVARAGDKEQTLSDGQFTLAQDGSQNVTQRVGIPSLGNRVAVQVKLEYSGIAFGQDIPSIEAQAIHYWVNLAT